RRATVSQYKVPSRSRHRAHSVPAADGNRHVRPTCRHSNTHGRPGNWLRLVALAAGSLLDSLSMILTPAAAADPVRSGSPADPRRISYCRPLAGSNGLPDGCRLGVTLGRRRLRVNGYDWMGQAVERTMPHYPSAR